MMTRYLIDRRPIGHSQRSSESATGPQSQSQTSADASLVSSAPQTPTPHRVITSTPSPLPQRASFLISWENLWFHNKRLHNARLRPVSKQQIARFNSYVWQHGAEIEADGYKRLWVCRICHQLKNWHHGVYVASSTGGISGHLAARHSIRDPNEDDIPTPTVVSST